jgi:hypothetical protein
MGRSQQTISKSKSTTRNRMNNRINTSNQLRLKILSMIYCKDPQQEPQQQQKPQHPKVVEVTTVETLIQVRQQPQSAQLQSPQQPQQIKSSDSPIKMVDIIKQQEQFEKFVISEIEGRNIEPDADYKIGDDMLHQKQMYADNVKKFDSFRGGQNSFTIRVQLYVWRTTRQWRKSCSERRQQSNLSASIKTA